MISEFVSLFSGSLIRDVGEISMFVLIVIVVVLCCALFISHRRKYKFADGLPGLLPVYPLLGNGDIMLWKSDVQRFDTMVKIFSDHDRLVKVWAGPQLLLFTCHPDLVQQILSSNDCLEKPFLYSFAGFEQGLFTSKFGSVQFDCWIRLVGNMIALAVIVVLICSLLYLSQRRRYQFANNLPQLKPCYPVLGNGALMFGKNDVQRFDILVKIFSDYDRLVRVWAGSKMLLFTCHPDLMQQILTSPACLEKPFLYSFAGFEHGLFTSKYKLWRTMRKRLNPSFNLRILHGFIPVFVQCARKMVENLNENPDGTIVSMHKYTSVCTLEMACGTTLGSDITKRTGKEEFVDGLDIAFGEAARRMVSVHLYPNIVYQLTKYHGELLHARKVVCDFFNRLVTERRITLSLSRNNNSNVQEVDDDHKPKILIDQLLSVSQDGKTFSEIEINDNIYAVITGANDTSGLLIAHACLFLCFYKDIEQKLYAEIMEFMPTEEVEINPDSLKQLVYLEMFLKECLRHCPVAPNISRENMAEIEIDGVKVPPGNIFVMNFYALHRRKDIWGPDAEKFDPEQFSEERSQNRHPFAYLPFSGGNRICIGWRYAMFSMKVMLIYLIRNFQFETKIRPEDVRYRHDLTMKLPFDHMIKVTKRCTSSMNVTSDILREAAVQKEGRE